MKRLGGKRTLITGGAKGIGYGIAHLFLQQGAKVLILDKDRQQLEQAREVLENDEDNLDTLNGDITDLSIGQQAIDSIVERWKGIDILINNAGFAVRESFIDIPLDRWNATLNVNLTAMFQLSQLCARQMIGQGTGGSIVNMSSKNGLNGSSKLAHYNTSKAGVHLLTQSMAVELAPHNIRVNAVAPGFIETPLDRELRLKEGADFPDVSARTPMKRLGTVQEVANTFLFLASDEASFITGSVLVVDGGHLANASEI